MTNKYSYYIIVYEIILHEIYRRTITITAVYCTEILNYNSRSPATSTPILNYSTTIAIAIVNDAGLPTISILSGVVAAFFIIGIVATLAAVLLWIKLRNRKRWIFPDSKSYQCPTHCIIIVCLYRD